MPSPNPMTAVIDAISLFGQTLNVTGTPASIKGYNGEPLMITALKMEAPSTLRVEIDDIGPPAATLTLPAVPTAAYAVLKYKTSSVTTLQTTNPITYNNKPLIIRASLPVPGPGKWDRAELVPVVEEWQLPQMSPLSASRLDFVVFHVDGSDGFLWWLTNPRLVDQQSTTVVVPNQPANNVAPPGVQGPWGLETP